MKLHEALAAFLKNEADDFDVLATQIIENEQFADVNFDADPYLSDDE